MGAQRNSKVHILWPACATLTIQRAARAAALVRRMTEAQTANLCHACGLAPMSGGGPKEEGGDAHTCLLSRWGEGAVVVW